MNNKINIYREGGTKKYSSFLSYFLHIKFMEFAYIREYGDVTYLKVSNYRMATKKVNAKFLEKITYKQMFTNKN